MDDKTAKSVRSKLSPEERLQKSLDAAAKILNKAIHQTSNIDLNKPTEHGVRAAEVALEQAEPARIVLYQVWCPDERRVVSRPTTNPLEARRERDSHNASTGHLSEIKNSVK